MSMSKVLDTGVSNPCFFFVKQKTADEMLRSLVGSEMCIRDRDILKPLLAQTGAPTKGIAIIGTVQGDLHDIGKNLVSMMLEGAGFTVVDIGVDIPAEKFVEAAKENKADIIGLSALLTTTMPAMKEIIEAVRKDPVTKNVKVIIGGAPLTPVSY